MTSRIIGFFLSMLGSQLWLAGCCGHWPQCKLDADCTAPSCRAKAGRMRFCIAKICRECKTVSDCANPPKQKCQNNRCIDKTCADIQCPSPKRCNPRTLACEWICQNDGESPCDGDPCKFCKDHICIEKPPACLTSEDCPHKLICLHPERCDATCTTGCDLIKCPFPYECYKGICLPPCDIPDALFDPLQTTVKSNTHQAYQHAIACMRKKSHRKLAVIGHGDEGETREYNIHLNIQRARAARRYLLSLGVSPHNLCLSSLGKEQLLQPKPKPQHSQPLNRRVSFQLLLQCP